MASSSETATAAIIEMIAASDGRRAAAMAGHLESVRVIADPTLDRAHAAEQVGQS